MPHKELKTIPRFETEDEERAFWATHDSGDYVDWSKAEVIRTSGAFPNLKRTDWSKSDLTRNHVIPVTVPDEEYERLDRMAREEKKTIGELVRQIFQNGLNNLVAHRLQ
ncbi:MAG TPA: CopG family antitoxin [Candidatus Kapabacteria bacterium]|nr:CopG family antitoxin [Candidatus Kapabacteria bacterium]